MIPYVTIIVLNSLIMTKIYKSTRFQKKFRYKSTVVRDNNRSFEVRFIIDS
jgi:hypothetical protein